MNILACLVFSLVWIVVSALCFIITDYIRGLQFKKPTLQNVLADFIRVFSGFGLGLFWMWWLLRMNIL